jgi:agmatinase
MSNTPKSFDPNAAASGDSGIFGLPYSREEAQLVYLPVAWEATTSYGAGTSNGPDAILEASRQVDLYDIDVEKFYECGLHMLDADPRFRQWNEEGKALAQKIIEVGGDIEGKPELKKALARVNELSVQVNEAVRAHIGGILKEGKIAALVGGDHATPFGAFQAAAEKHPQGFGILHFDAHSDTRIAYEGFEFSHASIMHNALERIPQIRKLVQVGIRDFCEQEWDYCRSQGERVRVFFDSDLQRRKFEGESWSKITNGIVASLPRDVWISFDIDGLDPRLCPNTGTPVPGGLDFHEAIHVIRAVALSGRRIIGFDLNEVAPDPAGESEWDANVGARLLYKMTGFCLASQGKAKAKVGPTFLG